MAYFYADPSQVNHLTNSDATWSPHENAFFEAGADQAYEMFVEEACHIVDEEEAVASVDKEPSVAEQVDSARLVAERDTDHLTTMEVDVQEVDAEERVCESVDQGYFQTSPKIMSTPISVRKRCNTTEKSTKYAEHMQGRLHTKCRDAIYNEWKLNERYKSQVDKYKKKWKAEKEKVRRMKKKKTEKETSILDMKEKIDRLTKNQLDEKLKYISRKAGFIEHQLFV